MAKCSTTTPIFYRFLATGDSYFTIATAFRMSKVIVSLIIPETCNAIWEVLQPKYMPTPDEERWRQIAEDFYHHWQFPNCVGSIDGKHVTIQAPDNSGSQYFNYKKNHSIVLLAVADAQYNFVVVDIGAYGSQSDGSVFANSVLGSMVKQRLLPFPKNKELPGTRSCALPYVLVGDEAFPLLPNLMRPFPSDSLTDEKRIYNYRLSRARRVVENSFGILASRFRCFRRSLIMKPSNAVKVVKASVVLHNFLRKECSTYSTPQSTVGDGFLTNPERLNETDNQQMSSLAGYKGRPGGEGRVIRQHFLEYFNSEEGSLPWQNQVINRLN